MYVDDKLRRVEPSLMVRATAEINDSRFLPMGYLFMIMTGMITKTWSAVGQAWRALPYNIRQWCTWIMISAVLAMIMAALGIHAWKDTDPPNRNVDAPDVEWYSRDDDHIVRKIDENRARTVPCISKNMTRQSRIHKFIAFDKLGNRYRVGVDSYAEISLISPSVVRESWDTTDLNAASIGMSGIGGKKLATKAVKLPIQLHWKQPAFDSRLYDIVGATPEGVDILMDLNIQDELGTVIDRPASTIMFSSQKVNVKTDIADRVTARMESPPVTVVATNAGCNFAYAAVRSAGFRVKKWYSVEADATCRRITETIVPAAELQHIGHHTEQVGNQIDDIKVDLFIDTSPCQPWSRCNGLNAKGFEDSRAQIFTHTNALYKRLKITNPPRQTHGCTDF